MLQARPPHPCCRLSAAEQNEVESWFSEKYNLLPPYHNLYWTAGSVYTGKAPAVVSGSCQAAVLFARCAVARQSSINSSSCALPCRRLPHLVLAVQGRSLSQRHLPHRLLRFQQVRPGFLYRPAQLSGRLLGRALQRIRSNRGVGLDGPKLQYPPSIHVQAQAWVASRSPPAACRLPLAAALVVKFVAVHCLIVSQNFAAQ